MADASVDAAVLLLPRLTALGVKLDTLHTDLVQLHTDNVAITALLTTIKNSTANIKANAAVTGLIATGA